MVLLQRTWRWILVAWAGLVVVGGFLTLNLDDGGSQADEHGPGPAPATSTVTPGAEEGRRCPDRARADDAPPLDCTYWSRG
ncbi:hypothetical protein [Streptomyces silvensis]|uniref:Uncharacterized protein n=1 Tax=Streptomyces silvensis TaxID=1765722 RepID=A0A0W7WX04_9ACTN|nr:hypothetical protein [Streptomyces silvensis]KUF15105.1 hypothetical protein AT728_26985 [Streptomyces silvensis]